MNLPSLFNDLFIRSFSQQTALPDIPLAVRPSRIELHRLLLRNHLRLVSLYDLLFFLFEVLHDEVVQLLHRLVPHLLQLLLLLLDLVQFLPDSLWLLLYEVLSVLLHFGVSSFDLCFLHLLLILVQFSLWFYHLC